MFWFKLGLFLGFADALGIYLAFETDALFDVFLIFILPVLAVASLMGAVGQLMASAYHFWRESRGAPGSGPRPR